MWDAPNELRSLMWASLPGGWTYSISSIWCPGALFAVPVEELRNLDVGVLVAENLRYGAAVALAPAYQCQSHDILVEAHGDIEVAHDKAGVVHSEKHFQVLC